MNRFFELNKKAAIAGLAIALVIFAAASILLYLHNSASTATDIAGAQSTDEEAAIEALPASAAAAQNDYDASTQEIVDMLKSGKWQSAGNGTVSFDDKTYIETRPDKGKATHAYAIMSAENGDDGKTTLALVTETGNYIATLATTQEEDGSTANTLTCTALPAGSGEYVQVPDSEKLAVEGPNPEYSNYIGKTTADVQDAIAKYCTANHPDATKATWTGSATIDWNHNSITTEFDLDDGSRIEASSPSAGGELTVEESEE